MLYYRNKSKAARLADAQKDIEAAAAEAAAAAAAARAAREESVGLRAKVEAAEGSLAAERQNGRDGRERLKREVRSHSASVSISSCFSLLAYVFMGFMHLILSMHASCFDTYALSLLHATHSSMMVAWLVVKLHGRSSEYIHTYPAAARRRNGRTAYWPRPRRR